MRLLRHPAFLAVSLGHLVVDVLNGQTGILLAVLSVPLGLSNASIGLIATLYGMMGSLSQPFFGWLSDRFGGRWAVAGGILFMAGCFALVALSPGPWPLAFLVLGALGSAAFHPPATSEAAHVGGLVMAGHAATAASIFFLFGQGGLSFGPAIGGAMIDRLGLPGVLVPAALALPIGLFAAWHLRPVPAPVHGAAHARASRATPRSMDLTVFVTVLLLGALRTWAQSSVTTFGPKFFQDQGLSPTIYGAIVAMFMGGSALGGVMGGVLADRWGRRRTITLALAFSVVPLYFFPLASGGWLFALALVAGVLNGAPHSIFVTLAQQALPGRAALASGIVLGLMFSAGTLGAYVSGVAADNFGLGPTLQANAAISLAAMLLSLSLRLGHKVSRTAIVPTGD